MIELKIKDSDINAIAARIRQLGGNLKPAMQDIGEYLARTTKQRFVDGTAPDGTAWASNTDATLTQLLRRRGGASVRRKGEKRHTYLRKDGRLNKKGAGLIAGKRPLIGESKRLSREIHYRATADGVEIGSSLEYAATQQFGAKAGVFGRSARGPIPWGDIPARPFLGLSDKDKNQVVAILNEHLEKSLLR